MTSISTFHNAVNSSILLTAIEFQLPMSYSLPSILPVANCISSRVCPSIAPRSILRVTISKLPKSISRASTRSLSLGAPRTQYAPAYIHARRSRNGQRFSTSRHSSISVKEKIQSLGIDKNAAVDHRIYFLGLGAVGKLIAYSFAEIPDPPPITLLFRNQSRLSAFVQNGSTLEYSRNGIFDRHGGYSTDYDIPPRTGEDTRPPIYNLVVGTKATFTAAALLQVKDRLRAQSTIVLLQNGMGLVEELNERVFPDIETRPHYIVGIVSHGITNKSPFSFEHMGMGTIALTALPKVPYENESTLVSPVTLLAPSTRHLMRTFTRTPLLGGVAMSPRDLLLVQLEKMAGNCTINPLTAIFGCSNGEILTNDCMRLIRLLLAEISLVIRALPELEGIPGIENRFSPGQLEHRIVSLATQTAKNRSSMLQDIDRGSPTEIEYLNGYIFRRGELLGIRSMVNYTIMCMVNSKSWMARQGHEQMLPIRDNESDLEKPA